MKYWIPLFILPITLLQSPVSSQRAKLYQISISPYAIDAAKDVGDLLTILIDEKASASDTGKNKSEIKDNAINSPVIDYLLSFADGNSRIGKALTRREAKKKFDAEAENKNGHAFTTSLQARIVDTVGPNQFLVQGCRSININGKSKEIYISGIVRKKDIGRNVKDGKRFENSVRSEQLAEARVEIDGEVVSKELQPGLFGRLMRKIF